MEKFEGAKRYGKAWRMFTCPRGLLRTPLVEQQVESFSLSCPPSNAHIDAGVIPRLECGKTGKPPDRIENKLLRTLEDAAG